MRRFSTTLTAAAIILVMAVSASAVPRLQTYITNSRYFNHYNLIDHYSWVSNYNQFDLNVVGYWGTTATNTSGGIPANLYGSAGPRPAFDYMDTYLSINVPKNQSGSIWINGVEITSFERYLDAVPDGANPAWYLPLSTPNLLGNYNFHDVGRLTNESIVDWHYGFSDIGVPGWGDMAMLDIVVEGFDWANFDAIGIDSEGRTITNLPFNDSSYFATPEPGTLSLLGLGLLGIVPLIRRKK